MTQKSIRTYTLEFKPEAIRLHDSSGKSMSGVERELGITPYPLSEWIRQYRQEEGLAFPGKGNLTELNEELQRLK